MTKHTDSTQKPLGARARMLASMTPEQIEALSPEERAGLGLPPPVEAVNPMLDPISWPPDVGPNMLQVEELTRDEAAARFEPVVKQGKPPRGKRG